MLDILFDIITRDIVMADDDFATTVNPSVQNGGNLLFSRCANITQPMSGIGMEDVVNSNSGKATFELNRWKQMAALDGATLATWTATTSQDGIDFKTNQSYL